MGSAGGWRDSLRAAWDDVARLVVPVWCAGCGIADRALCDSCRLLFSTAAGDVRAVGGGLPPHWRGDVPPLVAVARYQGPVRSALVAWKDHGRLDLTPDVGRALARSVLGALVAAGGTGPAESSMVGVVPVPSSAAASRRRGEDVMLTAAALAVRLAAPVAADHGVELSLCPLLRQRRGVADQAGLDAESRAANLAGAVVVHREPAPGQALILVDDVVTTGSSLREAHRVLGDAVAAAAVLAVTANQRYRLPAIPKGAPAPRGTY